MEPPEVTYPVTMPTEPEDDVNSVTNEHLLANGDSGSVLLYGGISVMGLKNLLILYF